jgi:predicted flavoprotein YhiN
MVENHQLVVIGAGAAGMMAAGRAAELGANVLLLEKTEHPGQKILITGNGHCNLTNSRDLDSFIAQFGPNGIFLRTVFSRFFRDELAAFLRRYKIECMVRPDGKLFPVTQNARDIVRVFRRYLEDGQVTLRLGAAAHQVLVEDGRVAGVSTPAGIIPASAVIIATGGSSHPQTGSTGDGYRMAAELGHTVINLRPGLVPLVTANVEQTKLWQGVSLRRVRITALRCTADQIDPRWVPVRDMGRGLGDQGPAPPVIESRSGDAVIVHFGLSGTAIWEMSLAIVDALNQGPVSVAFDLLPRYNRETLRDILQSAFDRPGQATFQIILKRFLPRLRVEALSADTGIAPDQLGSRITPAERERLLDRLKTLSFDILGPYSMATAMVTAGGVALNEINPATLESRLIKGLYFCGEVMDLDAGTGGYNLQAAFSTGYAAGESAALMVTTRR